MIARTLCSSPRALKLALPGDVSLELAPNAAGLLVSTPSHANQLVSFDWLLDTDQSGFSVHASNKQKFLHSTDNWAALVRSVPPGTSPLAAPPRLEGQDVVLSFVPAAQPHNEYSVKFCNHPPAEASGSREVRVPVSWLLSHASPQAYDAWHSDVLGIAQPWSSATLGKNRPAKDALRLGRPAPEAYTSHGPLFSDWRKIVSPELDREYASTMIPCPKSDSPEGIARLEALYALVFCVLHDGFAFLQNVPTTSKASVPASPAPEGKTTECESDVAMLYHVARTLGEIRSTFYGTHLWDVRSVKNSLNVAYTNADLGFHADLCYFANPPRFQLLHMLKNEVQGGESLFVDGFAIAQELHEQHPEDFALLTKVPVAFHYQNDGRYYRYAHPTIELAQPEQGMAGSSSSTTPASGRMPRVAAINYSPPFQAPMPIFPGSGAPTGADDPAFKRALQRFAALTHDPRLHFRYQMQPGDCVIFDNRRVLHSRTGFDWDRTRADDGETKRWLKGTYVEGDAVWSTYRVLRARLEAARAAQS